MTKKKILVWRKGQMGRRKSLRLEVNHLFQIAVLFLNVIQILVISGGLDTGWMEILPALVTVLHQGLDLIGDELRAQMWALL